MQACWPAFFILYYNFLLFLEKAEINTAVCHVPKETGVCAKIIILPVLKNQYSTTLQ